MNKKPMMTVEAQGITESETAFIAAVVNAMMESRTDDCRTLAPHIRLLAEHHGLNMVVGCGGSHVYIHRAEEFISGDNTNAQNIRFAIITDGQ